MDKEHLEELAAAVEAERDALIQEANGRIAYLNGKAAALRELAASLAAPKEAIDEPSH